MPVTLGKLKQDLSGDSCDHGEISACQSEKTGGKTKRTHADVNQQKTGDKEQTAKDTRRPCGDEHCRSIWKRQSSDKRKETKVLCVCLSGPQICNIPPFFPLWPTSVYSRVCKMQSINLCLPGFYFHSAPSLSSIRPGLVRAAVIRMCEAGCRNRL